MDINGLRGIIKETLNEVMTESSFTRVKSHMEESGRKFAIITAFRNENNRDKNKKDLAELKKQVKDAGYSFTNVQGGFTENPGTEQAVDVKEYSVIITSYDKPHTEKSEGLFQLVMKLAKQYNQDAFIFGQPKRTATKDIAYVEDPKTGEYKPDMNIRMYDINGQPIEEPWAGPWSSLQAATNDDVYWTRIAGRKAKLQEMLDSYKQMKVKNKLDALKKEYYIKKLTKALID
jgi:hypothetical protein